MAQSCIIRNDWVCPAYVTSRQSDLLDALREHVTITVIGVVAGIVVALPLAVLVRRRFALSLGANGTATIIYTIPSLALLAFLFPITGLSITTVAVAMALYSLAILLRNTLDGLEAVPPDAVDAARGMGYGPLRLLVAVELPLAAPAIIAGIRIATVSTVALVTVGTLVGHGGFGDLINRAFRSNFHAEVFTATVATVLLALLLDVVLLLVQRAATPWMRGRAA